MLAIVDNENSVDICDKELYVSLNEWKKLLVFLDVTITA